MSAPLAMLIESDVLIILLVTKKIEIYNIVCNIKSEFTFIRDE